MKLVRLNPDDTEDIREFLRTLREGLGLLKERKFVREIVETSIFITEVVDHLENYTLSETDYDLTLINTVLINQLKIVARNKAIFRRILSLSSKYSAPDEL